MMEELHVTCRVRGRARSADSLATTLRSLRRLPRSGTWLRLAGTAAGEQAAAFCVVLFADLPDILLGTGAEVLHHG